MSARTFYLIYTDKFGPELPLHIIGREAFNDARRLSNRAPYRDQTVCVSLVTIAVANGHVAMVNQHVVEQFRTGAAVPVTPTKEG